MINLNTLTTKVNWDHGVKVSLSWAKDLDCLEIYARWENWNVCRRVGARTLAVTRMDPAHLVQWEVQYCRDWLMDIVYNIHGQGD